MILWNDDLDLLLPSFLIHQHIGILGVISHSFSDDVVRVVSSEAVLFKIAEAVFFDQRVIKFEPFLLLCLEPLW